MEWTEQSLARLARIRNVSQLIGEPLRVALGKSAVVVVSSSTRLTPVDTGRLRASITSRVDTRSVPLFAQFGSNVRYAVYVHEGSRGRSARPFFRQGMTENVERIKGFLVQAVEAVERAFR